MTSTTPALLVGHNHYCLSGQMIEKFQTSQNCLLVWNTNDHFLNSKNVTFFTHLYIKVITSLNILKFYTLALIYFEYYKRFMNLRSPIKNSCSYSLNIPCTREINVQTNYSQNVVYIFKNKKYFLEESHTCD
jgi:hypothetical protein